MQERGSVVMEKKACLICLDYKHQSDVCKYLTKNKCTKVLPNGSVCGSPHHELLHEEDETDEDQVESEPSDEE